MKKFHIHPDIRQAETLPAEFYRSDEVFANLKERIFAKSWQWIGDQQLVPVDRSVYPLIFMEYYLDEPIMLSRNKAGLINCLSNVCTHRGNLVIQHSGKVNTLRCQYHGRRFDLNGQFQSMPEFEEAMDFPRPCDNLKNFPLKQWGPFLFTGLNPSFDLAPTLQIMNQRIGFLPLDQFKLDPSAGQEYLVNCHWALYCDNYLEGFHIPFVHADLNSVLDYDNYTTVLYDYVNLQIGYAKSGEEIFELPKGHPDYGKNIGAYYYWVFPNMMFNFYPWGLSINVVRPINKNKTKVSFISYVYDKSKLHKGAGALLDKVEREDEQVVEGVHRGLQSRNYQAGRFSPTMEKGVHHFHRLLADF